MGDAGEEIPRLFGWVHALVRIPDGRYLDVDGLHETATVLDKWAPYCDKGDDADIEILRRARTDECPVDVTGELDGNVDLWIREDGTDHQTVVVPEGGRDHRRSERVDVGDGAAGHLDAEQQLLLESCRPVCGPTTLRSVGQILLEPDHELRLHRSEPGPEDGHLDRGSGFSDLVALPAPDRPDQPVKLLPARRAATSSAAAWSEAVDVLI